MGTAVERVSSWEMVRRQAPYWATVYARTWRGSLISSFLEPVLYVLAMGVLLGGFVHAAPGRLEGAPSYLAFIAPGLLAVTALRVAVTETTYPVMSMVKWHKVYFAMMATPLRGRDLVNANLLFVAFRVASTCAVFALVLVPFGVYSSVLGALGALLTSVLTGAACAAPVYGFSAGLRDESALALVFRLGVIPLSLFSGAFFPVANLGPLLEAVARATPLWHGVDLVRSCALGTLTPGAASVHLAYLLVLGAVGWWWSWRRLTRRLVV